MVARVHERIRWRRSNFTHQASRKLVNQYAVMAVEDLSVHKIVAKHRRAKSGHDVVWTQVSSPLACRAAWADRRYVAVDLAYTSQDCSGCGWRHQELTLSDRVFRCLNLTRPDCRLVPDRDRKAARNILARGRAGLARLL